MAQASARRVETRLDPVSTETSLGAADTSVCATWIYWLEQTEANLPAGNDWLSGNEANRLAGMRFAKRRGDWRLGRWTAKRAVAEYLGLPVLAQIEIRAAPCGAPEVYLAERPAAVTISLSHREGRALCAIAPSGVALGCDLELVEPHSDAFVADYFTAAEQARVARASPELRDWLLALLWSSKESVLKALRTGLRVDTRCVEVRVLDAAPVDAWRPMEAACAGGEHFHGWWREAGGVVRTLVAASAAQ